MVLGSTGISGEAGHMSLNIHGPKCYCGNRGCFELYCCNKGILSRAKQLSDRGEKQNDVFYDLVVNQNAPLNLETLFYAREVGSSRGARAARAGFRISGRGIANLFNIF
jgi:predicted NBD/HSP70 family sugar kinase